MPGAVAASRATAGATTCAMPVAKAATVTVPASPPVRGQLGLGALQLGEDRVGVAEQDLPGGGQPYALGAALDQAVARLLLQRGELLGDGRGVRYSAAAAAVTVRWSATARRMWSRRASIMGSIVSNAAVHDGQASSSARAATKASTARFTSSVECAAESCTRMRAWPCGTTG